MKKIILLTIIYCLMFTVNTVNATSIEDIKKLVPEDIQEQEWCFITEQCEVREQSVKLILLNGVLIRLGYNHLY